MSGDAKPALPPAEKSESGEPPVGRSRARQVWESRILRIGALAGAVAAVIGLVVTVVGLLDDDEAPAPAASIGPVDIGGLAGIRDAFARTSSARECADLPGEALRVSAPGRTRSAAALPVAAALPLAQITGADDPATTVPSGEGPSEVTTVPEEVPDARVSALDTETIVRRDGLPVISEVGPERPEPPPPHATVPHQQQTHALRAAPEGLSEAEEQTVLAQAALVRVGDSGAAAEPVGRLIDVGVRLGGLKDDCIQLAWSLYDASTRDVVPETWLRFRTGLRFVPTGDDERASEQFWVPLPRRGGRFYVRMGLFREDGTRLAVARSEPFAQPASDPQGFVAQVGT